MFKKEESWPTWCIYWVSVFILISDRFHKGNVFTWRWHLHWVSFILLFIYNFSWISQACIDFSTTYQGDIVREQTIESHLILLICIHRHNLSLPLGLCLICFLILRSIFSHVVCLIFNQELVTDEWKRTLLIGPPERDLWRLSLRLLETKTINPKISQKQMTPWLNYW